MTSFSALAGENSAWDKVISKASNAVVSIRVNAVRTFDTENSLTSQATGFVVDAKLGIILTNRHVVNPGPVTAEAIFSNSEEVELTPIYRDPVHDFGFFKYDPKKLKFIKPQALDLVDFGAKIGDEIKIIGNDSGEHMSILSATLARLDRAAPQYRAGGYNDFNTFYYQSAADTSGGSSGSPVVNVHAQVIALNAGGRDKSASSYFLPLFKVTRALTAIQSGKPIKRGTLQTTLTYQTYDQVRRLGLPSNIEGEFRQRNKGNGLLTVKKTVIGGPADKKLKPGDIIISIKNKSSSQSHDTLEYVNRHENFETFLDENVGQAVELVISRQGNLIKVPLTVADLHQITPDEYIEIAGGVLNNFSYQLARQTNLAVDGVYVSLSGFMLSNAGVRRGSVLLQINNQKISNLDDFQAAISKLEQDEYFTLKFVNISSPNKQEIANVKFQSNWHIPSRCKRNDATGLWPCTTLDLNKRKKITSPISVKLTEYKDKNIAAISRSLVMVKTALPYQVDGQNYPNYSGTGLILDKATGLVVVDRNTVPIKMAQVTITISGVVEIPAEVLFVHPLHSYALIKYDPKLLVDSELRSAQLKDAPLSAGDAVWLVGYQTSNRLVSEKLNVSSFDPLILPAPSIPQFRETNTNSVIINNPPRVASGVLLDKKGKVRAWWTNFSLSTSSPVTIDRGLPVNYIKNLRDQWLENGKIDIYSLEIELEPITIANARNYSLSDKWMNAFQRRGGQSQVLQISKMVAGSDSSRYLKSGDLLLTIDDQLITDYNDLDEVSQSKLVKVSVWRDGQQFDFNIKTVMLSGSDTEKIYLWSGALLQTPHRALAAQHGVETRGVYISWYWYGSPANRYGLRPLNRITEFEGEAVEDLEQFIQLTQKHRDKEYVRIRMLDLIGRESIITLKQDQHYWPTQKVSIENNVWKNTIID
jgi:S1-C subfamily serine protease